MVSIGQVPTWGLLVVSAPIVIVGASLVAHASRIAYQNYWKYRHIPGPPPHLLLGNLRDILKHGGSHKAMKQWVEEYGKVFKFFLLTRMFVVVADPDVGYQVLCRWPNRSGFVSPSAQLVGPQHKRLDDEGIVQARDGFWRMIRNAWQPAFSPGSLQQYAQQMSGCAVKLCKVLAGTASQQANGHVSSPAGSGKVAGGTGSRAASNGTAAAEGEDAAGYVDIHDLFDSMTLDVVGTCAYGVQFHALPGAGDEPQGGFASLGPSLVRACKDFFRTVTVANSTRWSIVYALVPDLKHVIRWLAKRFPDEAYLRLVSARETILATASALIEDWRAHSGALADQPAAAGAHTGGVAAGSFLNLLLEARQKAAKAGSPDQMGDITITAQVNSFILAGTETTANTLTFAVYYLCQHPDKEAKLLQEIEAHGKDKPIGFDDKFPYADAIINETMRLLPAAHATTRDVDKPGGAEVAGVHLAYMTGVLVPIYYFHHHPDIWPRAEEFLPERWLPEGEKEWGARHPRAYMPFGEGPRKCIGWKFALQEARIALVQIYKQFTFTLQPGQVPLPITAGFTLSPKAGLMVRVVRRSP